TVQQGRIVSQSPAPEATVRRGWKVRVAESLGPQRAAVPNLLGQSQRAAGINISRRGLETGAVGTIHLPGAQPETVVSQSPPPDPTEVSSPKVGLIFSAPDNVRYYVMPNFIGRPLAEATASLEKAGFTLGKVQHVSTVEGSNSPITAETVLRQYPQAGQKVA